MRVAGKIAVVVGGGQSTAGEDIGIGRACSLALAREGAKVLVVDVSADTAEATAQMIRDAGGEATSLAADISHEADCKSITTTCVERYGRMDVLMNNVGIVAGDTFVDEFEIEAWDRIVDVGLRGMALTCKHAFPVMKAQKGGSIINTSSGAALITIPNFAYSCAKAGVNALTRHVAGRGAPYRIRCNVIMPGGIISANVRKKWGKDFEAMSDEERFKMGAPLNPHLGDASDIANALLYFASDESRYVTSQFLAVDGGMTANILGSRGQVSG
jgi:NAD(P)-dependent dehydrogenase (short-subunit alcohol dehydrogenase family)